MRLINQSDNSHRLANEREQASELPPKNHKRRKYGGVHASDMSLVTPENIREPGKGGWKLTPMGRLTRSVRMRPERPLVLARDLAGKVEEKRKTDRNGKIKKVRRREKVPASRARRRTIDMTKWGSVHLKGAFLDVVAGPRVTADDGEDTEPRDDEESDSEFTDENDPDPIAANEIENVRPASQSLAKHLTQFSHLHGTKLATTSSTPPIQVTDDDLDMTLEKVKSLDILKSLFGSRDESEWIHQESVSDVNEERPNRGSVGQGDGGDLGMEVEEVPLEVDTVRMVEWDPDSETSEPQEMHEPEVKQGSVTTQATQATKLKDLFAPREEEG